GKVDRSRVIPATNRPTDVRVKVKLARLRSLADRLVLLLDGESTELLLRVVCEADGDRGITRLHEPLVKEAAETPPGHLFHHAPEVFLFHRLEQVAIEVQPHASEEHLIAQLFAQSVEAHRSARIQMAV